MYIASKSQKKSSNSTRLFGADVAFFRQNGRKPANSGKNGGISAKKQFANQINFHLYHYAGNNPVKYLDPDGNALHILVAAGVSAAICGIITASRGGSLREVAAAAIGGAVAGGLIAVTGGMSLGAQISGAAMANTAGYCAEKMIKGESASVDGMIKSAIVGTSGAMVTTVSCSITNSIITKMKAVPSLKNGDIVYRVYGADSTANGASWSTQNPGNIKNYRNKAGLPSGGESGALNSGQFVIQGTVTDSSQCILSRKAIPLDGNKGGLNEYIIPNAINNGAIKITNVSGVNPEF